MLDAPLVLFDWDSGKPPSKPAPWSCPGRARGTITVDSSDGYGSFAHKPVPQELPAAPRQDCCSRGTIRLIRPTYLLDTAPRASRSSRRAPAGPNSPPARWWRIPAAARAINTSTARPPPARIGLQHVLPPGPACHRWRRYGASTPVSRDIRHDGGHGRGSYAYTLGGLRGND